MVEFCQLYELNGSAHNAICVGKYRVYKYGKEKKIIGCRLVGGYHSIPILNGPFEEAQHGSNKLGISIYYTLGYTKFWRALKSFWMEKQKMSKNFWVLLVAINGVWKKVFSFEKS